MYAVIIEDHHSSSHDATIFRINLSAKDLLLDLDHDRIVL